MFFRITVDIQACSCTLNNSPTLLFDQNNIWSLKTHQTASKHQMKCESLDLLPLKHGALFILTVLRNGKGHENNTNKQPIPISKFFIKCSCRHIFFNLHNILASS
ncbi:unnamed protein product [Citrullus colocynthis]|uniref:Uncharacterized protein n=1 Tax=Citrullus colocynthis TaxID=252529 RepID=A0ABP0YHD3_9ROSI